MNQSVAARPLPKIRRRRKDSKPRWGENNLCVSMPTSIVDAKSIPKSKRQNVSDMYVLDNDHDEVGRKKLVCVDANVVEVRLVPI